MKKKDFIKDIYKDKRTVFNFREIAMLLNETDASRLRQKINYYVKTNAIINIRRGIYAKENYDAEELACRIFTPAYLSLEYVLQKAGVIFQYSEKLTVISYLSRTIVADNHTISCQKIKNDILVNPAGIIRRDTGINVASPERALLDMLYLNKEYYFDIIAGIDKGKIIGLLPVYRSKKLQLRAEKILDLHNSNNA